MALKWVLIICVSLVALHLDGYASGNACRGLLGAVTANDINRLKAILAGGCNPGIVSVGINPLEWAIGSARVEATRLLLEAGADPNATDSQGSTIVHWLGSGRHVTDDDLLEVAKLLDQHHCKFEGGTGKAALNPLVNLAPRRLPKTLAFLASKNSASDCTQALKAISKSDDIASIKVLLDAGADPIAGVALSSALSDAARNGQTPSVIAMLAHIQDKDAPKVLAAYQGAVHAPYPATAQAFVDAGVNIPQVAPLEPSPCEPKVLTLAQRWLLSRMGLPNTNALMGLAGGMNCKLLQECGDFLLIDCNSAADGPAYYIDQKAATLLATCGGACMHGCKNCPPKEWTCSCKR